MSSDILKCRNEFLESPKSSAQLFHAEAPDEYFDSERIMAHDDAVTVDIEGLEIEGVERYEDGPTAENSNEEFLHYVNSMLNVSCHPTTYLLYTIYYYIFKGDALGYIRIFVFTKGTTSARDDCATAASGVELMLKSLPT